MRTKTIFNTLLAGGIAFFFYTACSKDDNSTVSQPVPEGKQNVSFYLTDDPGFFNNVYLDIKSVNVLVDTCNNSSVWQGIASGCQVWQNLNVSPGIYDVLSLRNGADTLLAQGNVAKGKVVLIKIELGNNNSIVKDSVSYPVNLTKFGGNNIYITLKGNELERYENDRSRLWLDFDISRSIVVIRNQFYLNPVIRLFVKSATGSIEGKVTPFAAYPVISVYNATDTSYALPNPGGKFMVRGLKPGIYTLSVNASNGYADTLISHIEVQKGDKKLDDIKLRKE